MNDKKNENVDELASRIAELAIELKREIKNLTSGKLYSYLIPEESPGIDSNHSKMS